MDKTTWQSEFLNAGTDNGLGDLSMMIGTVSKIREDAKSEEADRIATEIVPLTNLLYKAIPKYKRRKTVEDAIAKIAALKDEEAHG